MIKTITDKLLATVVGMEDVERKYPGVASFKGRVALDVHIERGSLSVGKRLQLTGQQFSESLEVDGIEMALNLKDPDVVRILCTKPATLAVPSGEIEGWTIAEQ